MRAISWRREDFPLLLAGIVLCALTLIGVRGFAQYNAVAPFPDFHAFYCGAGVVLAHGDPYTQQPLGNCESTLIAGYFPAGSSGIAVPAPVPGYVFALFIPFALLPFAAASWLFFALTACAIAGTIAALRSLTGLSWLAIGVVTLAIDAPAALALGQVTPLAVFGLAVCALAMREHRWGLAVASSTLVWLLPQVAVAVMLALFVSRPAARVAIVMQIFLLMLLTFVLTGPTVTIEYITKVVPAHAASELSYAQQIALGPVLAQLGVPPAIGMNAGLAVWLCACAAAAFFARRLAARNRDATLTALMPAPFGLIGGTFLHSSALSVAFPLALLLASGGIFARYAAAALVLLLPWTPSGVTFFLWPLLMLAALVIAVEIGKLRVLHAVALGTAVGITLFAINVDFATRIQQTGAKRPIVARVASGDLAERSWTAVIKSDWALALSPGVWFSRMAGLAGTVIVCVLAAAEATRESSKQA